MEKNTENTKGVIASFKKGVVHESRDNFDDSVFNKVYRRASTLVQESVRSQIDSNLIRGSEEYTDNIITFIGRRGTGKTSVMLSFMEGLQKNCDTEDKTKYIITTKNGERVRFIGVDWIDASTLEKGEDIFETILAKMLGEFLREDENSQNKNDIQKYEKRELQTCFGNLYKKVLNLKRRNLNQDYIGESAISTLRDLARSNDLRLDFENLIRKYIDVKSFQNFGNESGRYGETFLLLAIDDVDMNVESGFEILEKIQRYLKVKGLIVLLSINYEQMKICCEKHFAKVFSDYSRNFSEDKQNYIMKLSEEYVEKVLPSYMRVYLPSMKKKDYDRVQLTRVKIETRNGEEKEFSIKNSIFLLAEQKTMVRYDSGGKKRHFMEPETLRSLNNNGVFFQAMETLNENEEKFLEVMDFNYRRSMDDLLFRFAFENLPEKERKFFLSLSEENIRRRGEIIVSRLLSEINKKDIKDLRYVGTLEENRIHQFREECEVFGYSYGELMRSFFYFGREEIFDRKLVHALLAMYSLVLTKIFYRYKKETNTEKKRKNYEALKSIMSGSAAGSWGLYLVPKMKNGIFSGAVKTVLLTDKYIELSLEQWNRMEEIKKLEPENRAEGIVSFLKELTPQIIVLLFLSNYQGEELEDKGTPCFSFARITEIEAQEPDADEFANKDKFGIVFKRAYADYNVLNFVNNIFIFDEIMEEFIDALCSSLWYPSFGKAEEEKKTDQEEKKQLKEEIIRKLLDENDGFYRRMTEWEKKSGGMAVPLYSTDIYYNMLKRISRELKRMPVMDIEDSQLFSTLKRLLGTVRSHLDEADKPYKDNLDNSNLFVRYFDECPVIQELMKKEDENPIKDIYNSFVLSLVTAEKSATYGLREFDMIQSFLE